jgi:membrane protein YqaA with SNARE-associated domain
VIRSLTQWAITAFASPVGIVVLSALDSTVFVSLPFGIDAAVIILAARSTTLRWLVPILAVAGSTAGAALTYWMGVKIGEKGLDRYLPPRRLKRVRRKLETSGAVAIAVLDLLPPPFPFTPFVLAAGALEVRASTFFITLVCMRFVRFGGEAILAGIYGKRIIGWIDSDLFHDVVGGFIMLALVLTVVSIVGILRSTHGSSRRAAA